MSGLLLDESFKKFSEMRLGRIPAKGIQAVLALQAEGATVPFISRYRKEKTGNLDEVAVRGIIDAFAEYQEIVKRKNFVLEEISKQGNLNAELRGQIETSWDLHEIEELYRPYKKKKKTKATLAREAGLEQLAQWLWAVAHGELEDSTALEIKAKEFINPAKGFATYDEALKGAQHILVEKITNQAELRQFVREELGDRGKIVTEKGPDYKAHSKYEMYAEFREAVKSLDSRKASHRYLALRRGWQEGELKVDLQGDEALMLARFEAFACAKPKSVAADMLREAAQIALKVHVVPSITNEVHNRLKERADTDAIAVFAENVRGVLLSSPFGAKVVLGVDPGIRTGCKIALIDRSGHFISHTVVHVEGGEAKEKAKTLLADTFRQIKIDAIAVGNGTGGREAEAFFRAILKEIGQEIPVIMVSESGASVYSASDIAREEFPELDLTIRGSISIARRLQDPLAELVKVEPKSIGVGQYQHDVAQPKLKKALGDVVESCVNMVGVDVNTASESLLRYVAGIGPVVAKNIVAFRREQGGIKDRSDLTKIPQFSSKTFEQAAGFLRVVESKNILDRTGVHPERYTAVREMAQEVSVPLTGLMGEGARKLLPLRDKWAQLVGEFTFDDILRELEKPGRDPRDPFKIFKYREDVHELKDLKQGMICPGVVTNVTNFGAFVDIGVHQDGLVHISEIADHFVNDPRQVVNPGDQVSVRILGVDLDKKQISLSLKSEVPKVREPAPPRPRPQPQAQGQAQGQGQGRGENQNRPRRDNNNRRGAKSPPRPDRGQPPRKDQRDQRERPQSKPFNNPFAALTQIKNR
jgi:protein Tex